MFSQKNPYQVLVVDDEKETLLSIQRVLRTEPQIEVQTAASADDAFSVLKKRPIHALLVDWRMPGVNGDELLRRLKRTYPSIPACMLSACVDPRTLDKVHNEGLVIEYLAKPFTNDELRNTVRRLVGGSAGSANRRAGGAGAAAGIDAHAGADVSTGAAQVQKGAAEVAVMPREVYPDQALKYMLHDSLTALNADSGTVYAVEAKHEGGYVLASCVTINSSITIDFKAREVALDTTSIPGYVALTGRALAIPDVYDIGTDKSYSFDTYIDTIYGYRTKSMLCMPIFDKNEMVIGLIEVVNRKNGQAVLDSYRQVQQYVKAFDRWAYFDLRSIVRMESFVLEKQRNNRFIHRQMGGYQAPLVALLAESNTDAAIHAEKVGQVAAVIAAGIDSTTNWPFASEFFSGERTDFVRSLAVMKELGKMFLQNSVVRKRSKLLTHQRRQLDLHINYAQKSIDIKFMKRERNVALRVSDDQQRRMYLSEIADERNAVVNNIQRARLVLFSAIGVQNSPGREQIMNAIKTLNELDLSETGENGLKVVPDYIAAELLNNNKSIGALNQRLETQTPIFVYESLNRQMQSGNTQSEQPDRLEEQIVLVAEKFVVINSVHSTACRPGGQSSYSKAILKIIKTLREDARNGLLNANIVDVLSEALLDGTIRLDLYT
ncbi:MAG: response regulator [Spirochaetaceae bacterium]|nr:response regulator [Spirochaetaceae bacterium]MCF7947158.1 response regulator [Spirochaetia bacterium]MCF7950023.1 response regulator [Spirochaetaceae bacterium]